MALQEAPIPADLVFKFVLVGDAGAGKSCILHQLIEHRFAKGRPHTVGVEFGSKSFRISDKNVNLQVWDTAGQERYRSVARSYYRGAVGALVVYDITNRNSYEHAIHWLADARSLARPDVIVIIVGNKVDLRSQRQVAFLEASRFAQENGAMFLETSALTGEGVEASFIQLVKVILGRIEDGRLHASELRPLSSVLKMQGEGEADADKKSEGSCRC